MEEQELVQEQEQEQVQEQEQEQEQVKDDNTKDLINDIKLNYEKKLNEQAVNYKKQIAERDGIIKQLLNGEESHPESKYIDVLNEKRQNQIKY